LVSIILPNLNTPLEFLEPRINSILDQSYKDWECIVIDGFSTNGSWEMILEKTKGDNRFSHYQKPAKGIYDAWNEGIRLARGEYIYIATSDDTCSDTFLEEMSSALDANMDCDIAHCCLNIIDENGEPTESQWHDWEKVKFYGDQINQYHKRIAPYDAIVHFGWSTVYTSIVQLLIRKSIFGQIGYFSTEYGSDADFEWGLRASLYANVIHVPLYLAIWRKHSGQSTDDLYFNTAGFYGKLISMAQAALKTMEAQNAIILKNKKGLYFNYLFKQFSLTPSAQKSEFLFTSFLKMPVLTIKLIAYRLGNIKFDTTSFIRAQLHKRNLAGPVNV
jgi:glycosyltransferase involved in cell wall biosynthesis